MRKDSVFKKIIWDHYREHGRELAWRTTITPYRILVSEVMLQQTQVARVQKVFPVFIRTFPSFAALAGASRTDVLRAWQGMGYNRRALALHGAAQMVVHEYHGRLPKTSEALTRLPGVGPATAASIVAFAFNVPTVFIETNIRRVYLHYFFSGAKEPVHDREIFAHVARTVDADNPRQWYYALMDYGSTLPRSVVNPNRRSAHYARQSTFEGSDRQLRGRIIRRLLNDGARPEELALEFKEDIRRVKHVIAGMEKEGFVSARRARWYIA
ncbi:MAG: hypothetical protein WD850_03445 [Candidatus Spechtbacterales bacterium]